MLNLNVSHTLSLSLSHTHTHTHIYKVFTNIKGKYRGSNSSNPPGHVQDRSQNFFHHNSDPWLISFRTSYKSSQSDNPLETRSCDGRTDGQSADNSFLFPRENALKWTNSLKTFQKRFFQAKQA
jgi:hypothetical protein